MSEESERVDGGREVSQPSGSTGSEAAAAPPEGSAPAATRPDGGDATAPRPQDSAAAAVRPDGSEAAAPRADGGEGAASRSEGGQDREDGLASSSRVSVVDEQPPRPAPPPGADEEDYKWHTYRVYPSGRPDAVEFIDVYKSFGRSRVLAGLNMGLPEGMVSMILGPSGTGKSVCIKHMVGLLYPDEGDVLVHGESVPAMEDEDEIEEIVMRRLSEVGLASAREKMPNELSGGMRKRAGFARALVLEPDIVLFDEPDSGLDPVRTALLGELILEVHRDAMEDAKKKQK